MEILRLFFSSTILINSKNILFSKLVEVCGFVGGALNIQIL